MEREKKNLYLIGESLDGDILEYHFDYPVSQLYAEFEARNLLRRFADGHGHIDIMEEETDKFIADVEM